MIIVMFFFCLSVLVECDSSAIPIETLQTMYENVRYFTTTLQNGLSNSKWLVNDQFSYLSLKSLMTSLINPFCFCVSMQRPEPAELELIKFHVENKPDIPLDRPEQ